MNLPDGYLPIRVVPKRRPGILRGRKPKPVVTSTEAPNSDPFSSAEYDSQAQTQGASTDYGQDQLEEVVNESLMSLPQFPSKMYVIKPVGDVDGNQGIADRILTDEDRALLEEVGENEALLDVGGIGDYETEQDHHQYSGESLRGGRTTKKRKKQQYANLDCPICGDVFISKAAYLEHEMIYHAGLHQCEACGEVFRNSSLLRRHIHFSNCGKLLERIETVRDEEEILHYIPHSEQTGEEGEVGSPPALDRQSPSKELDFHEGESGQEDSVGNRNLEHSKLPSEPSSHLEEPNVIFVDDRAEFEVEQHVEVEYEVVSDEAGGNIPVHHSFPYASRDEQDFLETEEVKPESVISNKRVEVEEIAGPSIKRPRVRSRRSKD